MTELIFVSLIQEIDHWTNDYRFRVHTLIPRWSKCVLLPVVKAITVSCLHIWYCYKVHSKNVAPHIGMIVHQFSLVCRQVPQGDVSQIYGIDGGCRGWLVLICSLYGALYVSNRILNVTLYLTSNHYKSHRTSVLSSLYHIQCVLHSLESMPVSSTLQ